MPQLKNEKKEISSNFFFWHGKKVERNFDDSILSIGKNEMTEGEIDALKKDLKKQFPDVDYVLVSQPYIESSNLVFERIENQQDQSNAEDGNENMPKAA